MKFICEFCYLPFQPNPKATNQKFFKRRKCKKKRRSVWQKKRDTDKDYRENQAHSQKKWKEKHPDYWKKYRADHPEYTKRNRDLQKGRNEKRKRFFRLKRARDKFDIT